MSAASVIPSPTMRLAQDEALFDLVHRHAYELQPLLAALELLTDSQRVLHELAAAVELQDQAPGRADLAATLSAACSTWQNPIHIGDPERSTFAVITDLARVAHKMAREISRDAITAAEAVGLEKGGQ